MNELGGLVSLIRARILQGRVPRSATARIFCGPGAGYPCACCGRSIDSGEREYEVEDDPLDANALYVMHARCFGIWSELLEAHCDSRLPPRRIDLAPIKLLLTSLA